MNTSLLKIVVISLVVVGIIITPTIVKAQEEMEVDALSVTPTPTPTFIKYDLAYPGILPDHPLYKLKVLRDKISAALISDPLKKIEFLLKQTDKGILASAILVDQGKIDLAAQTALKAEHNFTILSQELAFGEEGADDKLMKTVEKAALKHQEVLLSLAKRVPKKQADIFLTVADFSKRNWQKMESYVEEYKMELLEKKD